MCNSRKAQDNPNGFWLRPSKRAAASVLRSRDDRAVKSTLLPKIVEGVAAAFGGLASENRGDQVYPVSPIAEDREGESS